MLRMEIALFLILAFVAYGLSYTENDTGGVTAHLLLPIQEVTP